MRKKIDNLAQEPNEMGLGRKRSGNLASEPSCLQGGEGCGICRDALEYELGRWQKKVGDQKKEIDGLHGRLKEADERERMLHTSMDAVLISLALAFGEALPDGALKITVPLVSVKRNMRDFRVTTEVSADNERYEVFVRKAEPEKA